MKHFSLLKLISALLKLHGKIFRARWPAEWTIPTIDDGENQLCSRAVILHSASF